MYRLYEEADFRFIYNKANSIVYESKRHFPNERMSLQYDNVNRIIQTYDWHMPLQKLC